MCACGKSTCLENINKCRDCYNKERKEKNKDSVPSKRTPPPPPLISYKIPSITTSKIISSEDEE